ncbi:MAG: choice-of-anchor D domain-containing protein [Acidobacteriaceae bacterium]
MQWRREPLVFSGRGWRTVIGYRFKFLFCASFAASLAASAQQIRKPALGNEVLAHQRSAAFLAERGVVSSPRDFAVVRPSPAQILSHSRAQYRGFAQKLVTTGIPVPAWQPLGPAQVTTAAYGAVTGRVTSIAADPSDPSGNTVYVGTASGGVWKSTNAAGALSSISFVPLTDFVYSSSPQGLNAPSLSIGAISVQPVAPGTTPVLLVGTGEPNDTTASYFGSGILRSTDGGSQWTLISQSNDLAAGAQNNFTFTGNGFAGFAWGTVAGSQVVVAAVSRAEQGVEVSAANTKQNILGIYYSTDQGQTWYMATITDPDGGLVQSPETTFLQCQTPGSRQPCGNAITSVVWNAARKEFLAAVRFHGYYESPDGQNWTRLASQPGVNLTMLMCPTNSRYAGSQACPIYNGVLAVQSVTGDTFALTTDVNNLDQGLWQDDCNLTSGSCSASEPAFTQIDDSALDAGALNPTQPTLIPQADYDLYLAAVPAVANSQPDTLLFAGTGDIYRCDLGAGCAWRNTTHAQSSDCNSAHVAPAQFAIDSTFGSSGLLYFGNDGGLWRSTDAVNQQGNQCSADDASHFQNLNPGFTGSISDVEEIAPDPTNPQMMMVSLGPLGTAAPITGSAAWRQVLNGEGDYAAIDPVNPQNWYATSEFGIGINFCTSGSACQVSGFGSPVVESADVGNDGYGQIIPAPWMLDPQDSSSLLLGTCRVWWGPAGGGVQSPVSAMLDGNNGPYCNSNAEIRSLAASGGSAGTAERVYAGMAGLYDGGATVAGHVFEQVVLNGVPASPQWNDLSDNLYGFNPSGFDISSVYVDPHTPGGQVVYVTVQGVGALHAYRSTDGGSTWQNISRGLPDAPANAIVVDPTEASTVYLATDAGVYYTQNIASCSQLTSSCWSIFGSSLPNVPVTGLSLVNTSSGPVMLAATFGRGVWQIGLPNAATTTATIKPAVGLIFGNQAVGTTSAPQQLLVTNSGGVPLQISAVTAVGDFTEDGTCSGASLAPGNACIIEVRFAPTKIGADTGSLTVYGNVPGGQIAVPLSGTGTAGALITLTPSSLCFQSTPVGLTTSAPCGSSAPTAPGGPQAGQSIVIANTGGAAATLSAVSISGDFAIVANSCGSSLTAANTSGDSCTVSVTFTPTVSGSRTGLLSVVDSAGTQTAQLSGIGQSVATDTLSPMPLSFNFQSVAVGSTSAPQTLTMTNTGDQAVQQIDLTSPSGYVVTNDCGTTLAGHSACAILVSFAPTSLGVDSQTLTVSDVTVQGSSASPHIQQVALTGTGIAPPGSISISPNPLNFGYYAVNQSSPPQIVTLSNNSSASLSGITSAITGDFAPAPSAPQNACGATLSPGASCNYAIVFSPSQVNALTGSLTVTAVGFTRTIALSGSGAAFTLDGPPTGLVSGGQSGTSYTVNVNSVTASQGPVGLTCSVAPATATCSVAPGSVTLTGSIAQSATVTFTVPQKASAAGSNWKPIGLALAMLLPLGFLGKRSRKWSALAACVFLILILPLGCGVASSAGSGSSGGGGGTSPPPPTTTYTVTVTGSVPGLTRTATTQISVE